MNNLVLKQFIERIDKAMLNLAGIAVSQHGKCIDEHRWTADSPHRLYSLSKSFTSTAVGMAIDEGYLRLTDKPVDIFAELLPEQVDDKLENVTLRDLLMMASGHDKPYLLIHQRDKVMEPDWVKYFLNQPMDLQPGTKFVYDTGCTYVAGAMVQKVTRKKIVDFLMPRLFDKFEIDRPAWLECPKGRNIAGDGLFLRTKELLKFGQLYLQKGIWLGERLISADWINEATKVQIVPSQTEADSDREAMPDWGCGYGYQFWMCQTGAVRADGKDSQFCIIDEKLDAVIAITADEERSQEILTAVWEEIYPRLKYTY
ncbi:serine hydrolase domain-containing protein [Ruminococcus gauvreauii]|uniref:Beta-lactamase family protein n=1 Tax=Ruminococcus gauvreauii TaxID=438033 RepID=A0ABY5VDB3_9FIRM|nr:serine hydrolase [Ruminococcus gauvreauii]UWP58226.1 beta-lactamase family protein [Ruminococcus gauvreauii]